MAAFLLTQTIWPLNTTPVFPGHHIASAWANKPRTDAMMMDRQTAESLVSHYNRACEHIQNALNTAPSPIRWWVVQLAPEHMDNDSWGFGWRFVPPIAAPSEEMAYGDNEWPPSEAFQIPEDVWVVGMIEINGREVALSRRHDLREMAEVRAEDTVREMLHDYVLAFCRALATAVMSGNVHGELPAFLEPLQRQILDSERRLRDAQEGISEN